MNITKLDNSNALKITLNSRSIVYMLDGRFHHGNGLPAVITPYSQAGFGQAHLGRVGFGWADFGELQLGRVALGQTGFGWVGK